MRKIDDLTVRERHRLRQQNALAEQWFGLTRCAVRPLLRGPRGGALLRLLGPDGVESVAALALVRASRKWDPARGVLFKSYACAAIRREVLNALADADPIRVPRWLSRCVGAAGPRHADAAAARKVGSLGDHDPPAACRGGADSRREEALGQLGEALARPDAVEREVIRCRYFEGMLLAEAGGRLGLTGEGVRQIQRGALSRLRELLSAG